MTADVREDTRPKDPELGGIVLLLGVLLFLGVLAGLFL